MSIHFIKNKVGSEGIKTAKKQQAQLAYFTQSSVQQDITIEYLEAWANRKFVGEDSFLNWVKSIFRTDNFLTFFKYLRFPVPSSKLVNTNIKDPLGRVFFAEDSFFDYTINGEKVETPDFLDPKGFTEHMFDSLLFRHNDILIHDVKGVNEPFRHLVSINNVVALNSHQGTIKEVAYSGSVIIKDKIIEGIVALDSENYMFFEDAEKEPILIVPHDLGVCPADYISKEAFGENDIVRKSIFSYTREELEEYTFLKTLQKMTEPNGAIPVVTMLDANQKKTEDVKGSSDKEPMSPNLIGGQKAQVVSGVNGSNSLLQTGSEIKVPIVKKTDGSIDMDVARDFLNFFHAPVESLTYIDDRLKDIKQNIIASVVGSHTEVSESAKNELQISQGYISKQDVLRQISAQLTRIRKRSDWKMLALKHGKDAITVDVFFGSDFFLETQEDLYDLFNKAPNPIEKKSLLNKIAKNRSRFNVDRGQREIILNSLLPYASDSDFDKATARGIVDNTTFQYQTRFNYWIGAFEASFGDILEFWKMMEGTNSEKLILINKLIIDIINEATIEEPEIIK
jgi:hypothetical protein